MSSHRSSPSRPVPAKPMHVLPPPLAVRPLPQPRQPNARPRGHRPYVARVRLLAAASVTALTLGFGAVLGGDGPFAPAISTLRTAFAIPSDPAPTAAPTDDERAALYLARSTLMALDDANRTGNYSVLRLLGSPSFQSANSPERLSDVFAKTRHSELDLSVAALGHPRWSTPPAVGRDRLLRLIGAYDLPGADLRFALAFEPAAGAWRLHEIHVAVEPALRAADVSATR